MAKENLICLRKFLTFNQTG